MAKTKIYKTINGINGININKVLEYSFNERSRSYWFCDDIKTFIYLMRKELFEGEGNERNRAVKEHFEKFWCVTIRLV